MDYLAKIKEKDLEIQASGLDHRWQLDADLLHLLKYVMMDKDGKHAVPDVINSTLNKPAVLAATVISALGSVKQQLEVSSESSRVDTTEIEEILNSCLDMANNRNRKMRLPLLNPAADILFCMRGSAGRRILLRMIEGELVSDVQSWDGRYIRHEIGANGLEWASYTTLRTKGQIEADAIFNGWVLGRQTLATTELVRDVWDTEHNEIWVGNRKVFEQPHDYGFTPVVLSSVSLGYGDVLMDAQRGKYEGESIFFLIRDIVPQLNMLLSILQTLNFMSVKRPMSFLSKEGSQATPPEYDTAMAPGAITSGDLGGGLMPINFGDATRAAEMIYRTLEKAIQEGGYTDIDIGNVQQPFSAVALMTIGESKDQVYMPRLAAKEWLNTDTAEMMIKQLLQIGGTLELGTGGHKKKFSMSDLDGEYDVNFRYFIKSPKIDVARITMAQQAQVWYPREYIYKEVLQVEDPKGLMEEWYSQKAEELDPNVLKHRTIIRLLAYAEEHDDVDAAMEAKIMAEDMRLSIEQIKAGQTAPNVSQSPIVPSLAANAKPLLSLLPTSGQGGTGMPQNPANQPLPANVPSGGQ